MRATAADETIVSPACAGMIPAEQKKAAEEKGEPRMRGDDPRKWLAENYETM